MATGDNSTSTVITLERFNERTMDFLQWLNTFEQLATSLKIPDNETVKFLLDWLEPSVFPRIQPKLPDQNPFEIPYDQFIAVLTEMFTTVKAEDVADHRFLTRVQLPYESVDEYVESLKKLSSKSDPTYKSTSYIKNIFIKGLHDQETKKILYRTKYLTFSMAIDIAKQMEEKKKVEILE